MTTASQTTPNHQFCDLGSQYRSAIFHHDAEQKRLAEASRDDAAKRLGKPVVTEIVVWSATPKSSGDPAHPAHCPLRGRTATVPRQ